MISIDFKDNETSKVNALEMVNRLHIIVDGELMEHVKEVPDYIDVMHLASPSQVQVQMNKKNEGQLFTSSMNVVTRFLDTRTGADVWIKRNKLRFDNSDIQPIHKVSMGISYQTIAPFLWDETFLETQDAYLGKESKNITVLSSVSQICDELDIDLHILSDSQKKTVSDRVDGLKLVMRGLKKGGFNPTEMASFAFMSAFGAESDAPTNNARRANLMTILNHGKGRGLFSPSNENEKKEIDAVGLLPSLQSFCSDKLAAYGHKLMHNFIVAAKTPIQQVNRAFFAKDLYTMCNQHRGNVNQYDHQLAFYNALCLKDGFAGYKDAMEMVDNGIFPLSVVGHRHDVPTMSVASMATNLLYTDFAKFTAIDALPKPWFEDRHASPFYLNNVSGLLERHVIISAETDGREFSKALKEKDKATLKDISKRWEWLSKRPEGVDANKRLVQFDAKYKYKNEVEDSRNIIVDLMNGVLLRVISELPENYQDCVYGDFIEGLHVEIDWQEIMGQDELGQDELGQEVIEHNFHDLLSLDDPIMSSVKSGAGVSNIAKMSQQLHSDIADMSETLGRFNKESIPFVGVTDDTREMGGYDFIPLDTNRKLLDEGTVQEHCVYTYLGKCLAGECAIVSMRSKENERVATIELVCDFDRNGISVESALGFRNEELTPEMHQVIDNYITKLNSDCEMRNPFWEQENRELSESLQNKKTKMTTLSLLSLVPFKTDAAFYAYGLLDDYVPGGVDSVITPGGYMDNLIKQTSFGQLLEKGRSLMKDKGSTFIELIPDIIIEKIPEQAIISGSSIQLKR